MPNWLICIKNVGDSRREGQKGPGGAACLPYLDENCYETDVWIWDTCFMALFSKYAPKSFPGKESLDNFYFPMYRGVSTPLRIHMRDNPPLFAWLEWENYRFSGDKARVEGVLLREQFLQRHFRWFNTAPKGGTGALQQQSRLPRSGWEGRVYLDGKSQRNG